MLFSIASVYVFCICFIPFVTLSTGLLCPSLFLRFFSSDKAPYSQVLPDPNKLLRITHYQVLEVKTRSCYSRRNTSIGIGLPVTTSSYHRSSAKNIQRVVTLDKVSSGFEGATKSMMEQTKYAGPTLGLATGPWSQPSAGREKTKNKTHRLIRKARTTHHTRLESDKNLLRLASVGQNIVVIRKTEQRVQQSFNSKNTQKSSESSRR